MEVNVKTIIFLFIFILIGIVLFQAIYKEIVYVTTSGTYTTYTTVSGTLTETTSSFVPNPAYVGSSNATIVSPVPIRAERSLNRKWTLKTLYPYSPAQKPKSLRLLERSPSN